jgi:SAM-dependent methyltransferase
MPARPWWKRLLAGPWRDRVDWRYRADTGGEIAAADLIVDSPNAAFAHCYRPTLGWVIRLLRQIPADLSRFNFIDFGSGKGRALLVASEFAFRSIAGVEFSAPLHEIALCNIAKLPAAKRARVRALLEDATQTILPAGDVVCYIYNSFGPPVLDAVVANMAAHKGGELFVIYINPKHRDVFERDGRFAVIFTHRKGLIYRLTP